MENWSYTELKDCILENYNYFIEEEGDSKNHSLSRTFNEFFFESQDNYIVENLITVIETAKISIRELGYLRKSQVELIDHFSSLVSEDLLKSELTNDEIILLKNDLKHTFEVVKTIEIKSNEKN